MPDETTLNTTDPPKKKRYHGRPAKRARKPKTPPTASASTTSPVTLGPKTPEKDYQFPLKRKPGAGRPRKAPPPPPEQFAPVETPTDAPPDMDVAMRKSTVGAPPKAKLNIQVTPKQRLFMEAKEDEVLYGGAAGGGKSYVQLLDNMVYALTYPGIKQLVLRRTFPELERSLIRTALEIYPQEIYKYNSSKHTMVFANGSLTDFGFCDNENDVHKYMSTEYDVIRFDEATHFTEYMYLYLKSRVRGTNKFPKQIKSSSNPGNVGHTFFKSRFIDIAPPQTLYHTPPNRMGKSETRLFIPSKVTDNTFLMDSDPDYLMRLEALPEEERKALLDGSWDLYEGQFFPEFSRQTHVIRTLPPRTPDWRVYFTMDYGLDCFAGYFIAVDNHEYGYVLGEIYQPNVIISDAARMIKEKQKELGIEKVDMYLGPSDMWNRRQETGLSVADIFYQNGIKLYKTSRDRIDGWAATKEWLRPFLDEQGIRVAKIRILDTCINLIRTLPALQYDPNRPSDAAVTPHDVTHAPDALRYFCVYRSRANRKRPEESEALRRVNRELNNFNDNKMFDVYGKEEKDDNRRSYNPMYL